MREAIEIVLDRAEDGEVKWVDVRDEISSGQWGRLIEKEILVDGETGFAVTDAEAIRAGLDGPDDGDAGGTTTDLDDVEETTWTTWDKAAGAITLSFFVGYTYEPVRDVIGSAIDLVLGPLAGVVPFYAVIMVIALATGFYSSILRGALMNMDKMAVYQERMQDIKERREAAKERDDEEALDEIQQEQMEAMGDQLGMFKEQFRPMVWIMFLTIPAFLWMYWVVGYRGSEAQYDLANVVVPIAGEVTWTTGVVGPIQVWIVWYFLCSMAFNQVIMKSLDIDMSPTTG